MACVCTSLETRDDIVYHVYSSVLPVLFHAGSYCSIHALAVLVNDSQSWCILPALKTTGNVGDACSDACCAQ